MNFKDHFSTGSSDYARFRPRYPDALFDWLAGLAPNRQLAWDAATGSGQAAVALSSRFERVIATDASTAQLASAQRVGNVEYRCERAERSTLDTESAGLITVAQGLHWLDHPSFFAEVERVLTPGGALAVWCYETFSTDTRAIDELVSHFYNVVVGAYWPPERRWIESGYAEVVMPFSRVETPSWELSQSWNLDELVGYLGTWSAVNRYRRERGEDPLPAVYAALAAVWGDPAAPRAVSWPLKLLVSRREME